MDSKVLFLDFKTKENADKARKNMAYAGLGMTLVGITYCVMTKQKVVKSIAMVLGANAVGTMGAMGLSYAIKK